jgi:hypothetical protein
VKVSEGEEKGEERIFEDIKVESLPNLIKGMNVNIQEAQQYAFKMNSKKPT